MDEKKKSPKKSRRRLYEEPSKETKKSSGSVKKETAKKASPKKSKPKTSAPKVAKTKSVSAKAKTAKSETEVKKVAKKAPVKAESKVVVEKVIPEEVTAAKVENLSDNQGLMEEVRLERVNKLIKKYVKWSAGLSLIPVPVFDLATLVTAQTTMIAEIASIYDVPFHEEMKKSLFSVIVSGLFAHSVSHLHLASLTKFIPGFGLIWSAISFPIAAAATTYAVGKVFVQHFESGGTLLDFDPKKMKEYFRSMYEDGIKLAKS